MATASATKTPIPYVPYKDEALPGVCLRLPTDVHYRQRASGVITDIEKRMEWSRTFDICVWVNALAASSEEEPDDESEAYRLKVCEDLIVRGASVLIADDKNRLPHELLSQSHNAALRALHLKWAMIQGCGYVRRF